jgi:hypothetical protein
LASIGWNFHQPTFGKPTDGGDFLWDIVGYTINNKMRVCHTIGDLPPIYGHVKVENNDTS